jgi:hypothetical protein
MENRNYDEEVIDNEEIANTDVKINPDFYIHFAIVKCQNALAKNDVKTGEDFKMSLNFFFVSVENLESICKACNRVGSDYDNEVKKFEDDFKSEKDELIKRFKIANSKFNLILVKVFSMTTMKAALKL